MVEGGGDDKGDEEEEEIPQLVPIKSPSKKPKLEVSAGNCLQTLSTYMNRFENVDFMPLFKKISILIQKYLR